MIGKLSYAYYSSGYMSRVTDELADQYVQYSISDSKISSVTQYGNNDTLGQKIIFDYGVGYTDVRSSGNDEIVNNDRVLITYKVLSIACVVSAVIIWIFFC